MTETPVRRCYMKEKCINPLGSLLPATAEYFHRDKSAPLGICYQCKACARQKTIEYKLALRAQHQLGLSPHVNTDGVFKKCGRGRLCKNPDGALLPATTEYFYKAKHTRDGLGEYCIVCARNRSKEFAERNPMPYRQRAQAWVKAHPIQAKRNAVAGWHKRAARKRLLPDTLTTSEWKRAIEHFHGCCAVCGRQSDDLFGTHTIAADHWIPLSSPDCPGTVAWNIVPLCHGVGGCNNSKNSKDPVEWLKGKFGKRHAAEILARINTYLEEVKQLETIGAQG